MLSEEWPSAEPSRPAFLTWLHLPASSPLDVTILSASPLSYSAHWTNGRLTPCLRPCSACERGIAIKRRLIFYVLDNDLNSTHLLELPARLAPDIQRALATADGRHPLRGLRLILQKSGRTANGTIELTDAFTTDPSTLPHPPPNLPEIVKSMLAYNT